MKTKAAFKSKEGKNQVLKLYDSLFEKWPVPHEKIYVNTEFGETYIIASGKNDSPPLVLLHGSGMNSIMWMGDVQEYSNDYRVYAIDIPGEPGRSDENQLPLEDRFYADWLNQVFKGLSIEKASVIGISLGAWLAVKFSINYPEKVSSLALLSPSGIGAQKKSFLLTAIAYTVLGKRGAEKLCYKVNGNRHIPETMLKYQLLIRENFNYRRETIPLFSDEELKRLTMPTMLFVGEKDIMLHSLSTAKRLGNLLPHASINVLPETGHTLVNLSDKISVFFKEHYQ